ncbi:MAG: DUF4350 domain-containing protein [Stackebrandtia sp.]
MTDTTIREPASPAAKPATAAAPPLSARRVLIPLAVAAVLIVFTSVAVWIESPSPGDSDYLSPQADSDHGASKLADKLDAAGVSVDRHTDPVEAFEAAESADSTLFITAGEFLSPTERYELSELALAESATRIVVVLPPRELLRELRLGADGGPRIAAGMSAPDEAGECEIAEGADAGEARMNRQRYVDGGEEDPVGWEFCYGGALARLGAGSVEVIASGADAPFANKHIDEAGNADLALGLLGAHDTVVWLDQHSLTPPEPEPTKSRSSPPPTTSSPPPETEAPAQGDLPSLGSEGQNRNYEAFPAWMWAALIGLSLLGVLLALWRGRRLGPPVTEPLPAPVPAAETVHGRARLYRRASAYAQTMRALRFGALDRVRPVLRVSTQATQDEVVAAAAARSGWTDAQVSEVLYGAEPTSEAELLAAVHTLDALTAAIENANPQGSK